MSHQIIKQPNGKFALMSSIVDDFVLINADAEDIMKYWVEDFIARTEPKVNSIIASLKAGKRPYGHFTASFEEAVNLIKKRHGKNAESLKLLAAEEI